LGVGRAVGLQPLALDASTHGRWTTRLRRCRTVERIAILKHRLECSAVVDLFRRSLAAPAAQASNLVLPLSRV